MKSLLIVDDDKIFCEVLSANFTKRGYEVAVAHNVEHALQVAEKFTPELAVVDLKMAGSSGLELIPQLLQIDPETKIVVLTGFASVQTAVEAIKLGAIYYLTKPVGTEDIIDAFSKSQGDPSLPVETETVKLTTAEREHIAASFERNHKNISATARELGMHRRTLQRKLDKLRIG